MGNIEQCVKFMENPKNITKTKKYDEVLILRSLRHKNIISLENEICFENYVILITSYCNFYIFFFFFLP
jgi:hypothetical protein